MDKVKQVKNNQTQKMAHVELERQHCAQFAYDQRSCDEMPLRDLQSYALACGLKPYQNKGKLYSQLSKLKTLIETNKGQNDLLAHALRKFYNTCIAIQPGQSNTNNPEAAWKALTALELKEIAKSLLIKEYSSTEIDRMLKHELVKLLYGLICGPGGPDNVPPPPPLPASDLPPPPPPAPLTLATFQQQQQPQPQPSIIVSPTFHMPQPSQLQYPCPPCPPPAQMDTLVLDRLQSEKQELRRQLIECNAETKRFQARYAQDQATIAQLTANLKQCEDRVRQREHETKHSAATTVTIHEQTISDLKQQIRTKEQEVRLKDARVVELEAQLTAANQANTTLNNQLRSQDSLRYDLDTERTTTTTLRTENEQLSNVRDTDLKTISGLKGDLERTMRQLGDEKRSSQTLSAETVKLRDDNARTQAENTRLKDENARLKRAQVMVENVGQDIEVQRLETELEAKDDEVRRLREELRVKDNELSNQHDILRRLQSETKTSISGVKIELDGLRQTLEAREREVKQQNAQIKDLEQQLRSSRTLRNCDDELKSKDRTIETWKNEFENAKAEINRLNQALISADNVATEQIQEIQVELQQKEQKHQQELFRLQEENSARRIAQQQQNTETMTRLDNARKQERLRYVEQINELEQKLTLIAPLDCKEWIAKLGECETKLTKLNDARLQDQKQFAESRLADEKQIRDLQLQVTIQSEAKAESEEKAKILQQNAMLWKTDLDNLRADSDELKVENARLEVRKDELEEKYNLLVTQLQTLGDRKDCCDDLRICQEEMARLRIQLNEINDQLRQTQLVLTKTVTDCDQEKLVLREQLWQCETKVAEAAANAMVISTQLNAAQASAAQADEKVAAMERRRMALQEEEERRRLGIQGAKRKQRPLVAGTDIKDPLEQLGRQRIKVTRLTPSPTSASVFGASTSTTSPMEEEKEEKKRCGQTYDPYEPIFSECWMQLFTKFRRTGNDQNDVATINRIREKYIGLFTRCIRAVDNRLSRKRNDKLESYIRQLRSTELRNAEILAGQINIFGSAKDYDQNNSEANELCREIAREINNYCCGVDISRLLVPGIATRPDFPIGPPQSQSRPQGRRMYQQATTSAFR